MAIIHFLADNIFTIIWVIITMLVTSIIAFVIVYRLEEEMQARARAEEKIQRNLKELKKLNKIIDKQKNKLQAVISSIGEGLVVIDKNGKIQMINHIAGGLIRRVPEEMIGKNLFKEVTFNYEDSLGKKSLREIVKEIIVDLDIINITVNDKFYCQPPKAKKVPIVMVVAPLLHGQDRMAVILLRDASKEASVDRAKTEFVSLASHQLRTPLSTMSWYTEMMLEGDTGKLSKKQKEFLSEIHESNQRMTDLVNALLNISRIELGTYSVTLETVEINKIALSMLEELVPQIKAKKIKLRKAIAKNIPKISADPRLIRIIFQNLLTNAIKYTPEQGQVNLKVFFKKGKTKRLSFIRIEVGDSGFGIPKEEQPKIFSKFFRATNAQKKVADGNGLGLYLLKEIVDNALGKVWFESQENKGTTFYVELPISGMKAKQGTKALS